MSKEEPTTDDSTDPTPAAPLSPADAQPTVQSREEIESERARQIEAARNEMREIRQRTERKWKIDQRLSKSDARTVYLSAIQDFLMELEPIYRHLQVEQKYWEPDVGPAIATLERPGFDKREVLERDFRGPDGGHRLENPEALEAEIVEIIACLPDVLELSSAEVPYQIVLEPRGRRADPIFASDSMVISLPTLDRFRRVAVEWAEAVGMGIGERDDDDRGRIGEEHYE